jgi:hypothetical protein
MKRSENRSIGRKRFIDSSSVVDEKQEWVAETPGLLASFAQL